MSKLSSIRDSAYMVLDDLAFNFSVLSSRYCVIVTNLRNTDQRAVFQLRSDNSFILTSYTFSEQGKYKPIALVERNKDFLVRGLCSWANTQKRG